MNSPALASLSDAELIAEAKKNKKTSIINGFLFGFMIGVAVFSTITNGIGFFTFMPIVFALYAFNNSKKTIALKTELKTRNLNK